MLPTRRAAVQSLLTAPLLAGALCGEEPALPSTGEAVEPLAGFDEVMRGFLKEHKLPGGALAVARNGKVIYARGFGYSDLERKEKLEPNALFRISSVSKTLTAAAVFKLIEMGKLSLDTPALDHLPFEPFGKLDPRWKKITVRHLVLHTAGFDREKSGEVTGKPLEVAANLRVPLPVTPQHMVRYLLGRPLDFDPGAKFAYANPGYLALGRIIETVTRGPYDAFVKKEILGPLNLTVPQVGRELPEFRIKGEVKYYDRRKLQAGCIYPQRRGVLVPVMYGAYNFDAFDSFSGWVTSAVDLVRFASAFDDAEKCPILKAKTVQMMFERPEGAAGFEGDQPRPTYYNGGWSYAPLSATKGNAWHEGMMPGASALVMHNAVGISWSALFNMDTSAKNVRLSSLVAPLLGAAAAKVTDWPDQEVRMQ